MKTNHTNNTPKGMPPAQPDPGSYSWKLLLIKDARVHYVVLKQQPRTTHPTHQPLAIGRRSTAHRASQPGNQKHTKPTPRTHPPQKTDRHRPWSCCLRTQQCAKHYPPETSTEAFQEHPPPKEE